MHLKESTELQKGKYRILHVLGQGGFGITYLAVNILLGKKVTIKEFFPKDFCGRDNTSHITIGTQNNAETVSKLKERFLKEARNITKLEHPSIVNIHDIFEENDTAYYVMDYIEGENLNEIVKKNGPMSEDMAVKYICQVGEALSYMHSLNMTHFDVKPANIVVRKKDNKPILIDFGLSKQYNSNGDATSTLMSAASKGYSPIEMYNAGNGLSFSPQTDVYSLGATLYYLLTGIVPPHASDILNNGLLFPTSLSSIIRFAITRATSASKSTRTDCISSFISDLQQDKCQNIVDNASKKNDEETALLDSYIKKTNDIEENDFTENRASNILAYILIAILIGLLIVWWSPSWTFTNHEESIQSVVDEAFIADNEPNTVTNDEASTKIINNPSIGHKEDIHTKEDDKPKTVRNNEMPAKIISPPITQEDKIFDSADEQPQFPGGKETLLNYVANNIHYPEDAFNDNIEGLVVVQFVVKKDGEIGECKIVRSKHPSLDKEAIRVVKSLPRFIPGKIDGNPVSVWFTLPVRFKAT